MNRRKFLVGAAAVALVPFAPSSSGRTETMAQDGVEWFTNVPVQTQDGRTLRFYDDVMKGKILLINFFFTEGAIGQNRNAIAGDFNKPCADHELRGFTVFGDP